MLKKTLIALMIALMAMPAVAFASNGRRSGPNPPGHAYGWRAKQRAEIVNLLSRYRDDHDPETCDNPCHDHDKDPCETDDDDDHDDDDDLDDRDDDVDDDFHDPETCDDPTHKHNQRDLDRRRRTNPDTTKPDTGKRDDVAPDPRRPREILNDIADVEAAIRRERETHEIRMESLQGAREQAVLLGGPDEVATIDRLIDREQDRHAARMAYLETQLARLQRERKDPGTTPDVSNSGPSERTTSRGNSNTKRTTPRTARERVESLQNRIEDEQRAYIDYRNDLLREREKAIAYRDLARAGEIDAELKELNAKHERKIARMRDRLATAKSQTRKARTAKANPRAFTDHLDDARTDVRRARRTVSDVESGIDAIAADLRWISGKR